MSDVAIVRYHEESLGSWYIYGTTEYLSRPKGHYFHLDDIGLCYGPFESVVKALEGHQRWLKPEADNV